MCSILISLSLKALTVLTTAEPISEVFSSPSSLHFSQFTSRCISRSPEDLRTQTSESQQSFSVRANCYAP